MSNLIITIISIALVAVATAMGIYYGGSAYEDATAQAAANQMISDAQQIAAAYQLYSNANGGTIYEPINNELDFQFLVGGTQEIYVNGNPVSMQLPSYLNALPEVPSIVKNGSLKRDQYYCISNSYYYAPGYLRCLTDDGGTPPIVINYRMSGNAANNFTMATKVQLQVCQDIANQARGQGSPIDTTYFIGQSTSQFDCAAEDPNVGQAGQYDFVYRIL